MHLSHEINNTVGVITPSIETIKQRTQDNLVLKVLQIMEDELEKLKRLASLCHDIEVHTDSTFL